MTNERELACEERDAAVAALERLDAALVVAMKASRHCSWELIYPTALRQDIAKCLTALLAFHFQ